MDKRNTIETNEIDTAEIPEFVYESLARSLLPVIQKYYESDEGRTAFAEWKEKKNAEKTVQHKNSGRIAMCGNPPVLSFTNLQFLRYKQ